MRRGPMHDQLRPTARAARSHRRALPIAAALLVLVLSTACTSAGGGRRTGPPGVLRIGVVRPESLDPADVRSVDEILLVEQLFDGLTSYDPETLDAVPAVAASWSATPDEMHWDFTLRNDATFVNGRTITADDVKYSLERIARKGSSSPVADLLEPVTGYRAFGVDGTADSLAGVVVVAPDLVRFELDQPWSVLPHVLANPAFGIVPREAAEAALPAFDDKPVGSGPFRLADRTASRITLVPVRRSAARVRRIDVELFPDKVASYRAFQDGMLDWSQVPLEQSSGITTTTLPRSRRSMAPKRVTSPYLAQLFYGFNLKSPKFADPRFREAIVRAVDRDNIIERVYEQAVLPMRSLIGQGVKGHRPDACGERCAYDLARARELVAELVEAGPLPTINIDYEDERTQAEVAESIRDDLAEVGITAVLHPVPLADYDSFAVSGNQELFRLGWISAYPSPDALLVPMFRTGSPNNVLGYASPAVDDLLRQARADPDLNRRIGLYQQAEDLVLADLPILPIAQFQIDSVRTGRVRDLALTTVGTFDASKVWLAS